MESDDIELPNLNITGFRKKNELMYLNQNHEYSHINDKATNSSIILHNEVGMFHKIPQVLSRNKNITPEVAEIEQLGDNCDNMIKKNENSRRLFGTKMKEISV